MQKDLESHRGQSSGRACEGVLDEWRWKVPAWMWVVSFHGLGSHSNNKGEGELSASTHPSLLPDRGWGAMLLPATSPSPPWWTIFSTMVIPNKPFYPWVPSLGAFYPNNKQSNHTHTKKVFPELPSLCLSLTPIQELPGLALLTFWGPRASEAFRVWQL